MTLKTLRARLLAVAGLLAPASAVTAADGYAPAFAPVAVGCPGGCDPLVAAPAVGCPGCAVVGPVVGGFTGLGSSGTGVGLFAENPPWKRKRQMIDGQQQPACAVNSFPLSDWAYIRRYCKPTIIPGTCYGHFQTKWRKWEDHCPQQAAVPGGIGCPDPVYSPSAAPVLIAPPTYVAPAQPTSAPSQPLKTPAPMTMPETAPNPKKGAEPDAPKTPETSDSSRLVPVPELPEIPVALPSTLK